MRCHFFEEEEKIYEMTDREGRKWKKVYFGDGEHFKNWLDQIKQIAGEVKVEEVFFDEGCLKGKRMYRIWIRQGSIKEEVV